MKGDSNTNIREKTDVRSWSISRRHSCQQLATYTRGVIYLHPSKLHLPVAEGQQPIMLPQVLSFDYGPQTRLEEKLDLILGPGKYRVIGVSSRPQSHAPEVRLQIHGVY